MATIGTLAVSLTARTQKFERGMRRAQRRLRNFKNKIPGANLLLNRFSAALGVAGLTVFVSRSLQAGDTLGKLSDRTGIAITELLALQRAARLAGTGAERMQAGIDVMQKRLGEAARGSGAAVKALQDLNLSAKELIQLDPAEQFKTIADRIALLGTQSQKAAVTANIFSRSNQQMLNLLQLGREGIDAQIAKFKEWGIELTRVDVSRIEQANDTMSDLGGIIDLIGLKLAAELAPVLEAGARAFIAWGQEGEGWGKKIEDVISGVIEAGGKLADVLNVVAGVFIMLVGIAQGTFAKMGWLIAQTLQGAQQMVNVLSLGMADVDWGNDLEDQMDALNEKSQQLKAQAEKMLDDGFSGAASDRAKKALDELYKRADRIARTINGASKGGGVPGSGAGASGGLSASGLSSGGGQAADALAKHEETAKRLLAEVQQEIADRQRIAQMSEREKEFAEQILEIVRLRRDGFHQVANLKEELLGYEMQTRAVEDDRLKTQQAMTKLTSAVTKSFDAAGKAVADAAREMEQRKRIQAETVREVEREIAKLNARNDQELRAIDNAERRKELIEKVGKELGDQLADQLELAEASKRQREEAEKLAEANKAAADETERRTRANQKDLDITKRFANFHGRGGGIFGFGKGRVGSGNAFGPVNVLPARVAGRSGKASGAAPSMQLPKLPDPSPKIEAATKAIKSLKPTWDKVTRALTKFSDTTVREVDAMGKSATEAVQRVSTRESDLRARVRRIENQLAVVSAGVGGQ